jgi:hypothetical protein
MLAYIFLVVFLGCDDAVIFFFQLSKFLPLGKLIAATELALAGCVVQRSSCRAQPAL